MLRVLPLLTLVPTIFTFVVIVLINIGGIHDIELKPWQSDNQERNTQFELVSWAFNVDPAPTIDRYSYAVYMHLFCFGSPRDRSCRNVRANGGVLQNDDYVPNLYISRLDPFTFDAVNFKTPFAFYILAAIATTFLIFLGPIGFWSKGRLVRFLGIVCAAAGTISMLIASAVLTFQMIRLSDQVRNRTKSIASPLSSEGSRNVTRISRPEVSMNETVIVLTWTASGLMLLQLVMWIISLVSRNRQVDNMSTNEKYERSSV